MNPERKTSLNVLTGLGLKMMALQYNLRPSLKNQLRSIDGWNNFTVGIKTQTGTVEQYITFCDGHVSVSRHPLKQEDVNLIAKDDATLKCMVSQPPNEMLNMIMRNQFILDGNLAYLQLFNYYVSLLLGGFQQRMIDKAGAADKKERQEIYGVSRPGLSEELKRRRGYRMDGQVGVDKGVKYLDDPYLAGYCLEDFPRLQKFFAVHLDAKPEVDPERILHLTRWYRENGWEKDKDGKPWLPELRNALAMKYLMEHKQAIIRTDDLIAGSTGSKEISTHVFGDGQGTMFWAELSSSNSRPLNPYICTEETAEILHNEVLPFWTDKTFREYVRLNHDYPLCQRLDERWVAYYVWKSTGISHTIPNFKRMLAGGCEGYMQDIARRLEDESLSQEQRETLQSMNVMLEATMIYAENLAQEAAHQAETVSDPGRKAELEELCRICRTVPARPASSLAEALNSIYITWVVLNNENSDTGFSLGRLDQWLQPYLAMDMEKCTTQTEKDACVQHALDLLGCFVMRMTDHVPMLPDLANYLFGGATSTQAITLGGVTEEGEDAVNDMTYLMLKAAEMLVVRDVNFNCRVNLEKNSDNYLKRLCEVNILACSTPIMHNDDAMFKALAQHGYSQELINDWAATGCVEPTLNGRHNSATASILHNMVASMEMALNDGYHPVMRWQVGPRTGSIEHDDFKTFDEFFEAWATQQRFVIHQACTLNNLFGVAHQVIRPTPLLSVMQDGTIESAKDVLKGGARFNSSGTSNIGLADVTDSLLVIKQLVFDEQKVSFAELKEAVDADFEGYPKLHALVQKRVHLFGSGSEKATGMANRVMRVVHDAYASNDHYRGGYYSAGYWSMSQHVAYGGMSGTLPSGRLAGKAFTPGLTPNPLASRNLTDNINDVAGLDPTCMDNNIAFNVKITPSAHDSRETTVTNMAAYVRSYFEQGGMQMQFNVVTSEMLKDAMANPDDYRSLMVRISGYNAYFVQLNKDIQVELIERAEYGI